MDGPDFYSFLVELFTGSVDYNTDGRTDSQEFFDYLGEYFAGCP